MKVSNLNVKANTKYNYGNMWKLHNGNMLNFV